MDSIPHSWVQEVLRFSLRATASSTLSSASTSAAPKEPNLTDPKDPGKDPRFRKLVEGILFSRRLIATYNLVLLAILLVFTIWHWGEQWGFARRRKSRISSGKKRNDESVEERADDAWSSSSSTVEGTETPPDASKKVDANETSPLLGNSKHPRSQTLGFRKPYFFFQSWLQYQPPPIPVINRTLPPNSVSLFVIAFIALNFFYNLYNIPLELPFIFVFADRCGMLFSANLPLLYLLAAKTQPIKLLTGHSYESLNIFHRRVGELLCFEAFVHFSGMMVIWYGLLRHIGFTLVRFLFNRLVGLGLGALISYEVLYFTSLASFRQRFYEIFLTSHIFFHTAGLALLWFHHPTSRPYVGIALAIFLLDRLAFRLWLKSSSHPATLTVLEDNETILLSANWDITPSKSALLPKSMQNGWNPNDHIFLTIPSLSRKHVFQAHPFTIFSAAPGPSQSSSSADSDDTKHAWFTLLIRAQSTSGFTHTLLEHARTNPTTRIRLDGPYGSSHALDLLRDSQTAILVAGGSGIAVAYPLLWALLNPSANTDIESGSRHSKRTVRLLWITHSASHRSWVPEDKMDELKGWGLQVLIPGPTSEVGRPDVRDILRGWIGGESAGIVVSGPEGLVRGVRNVCAESVGEGGDVRVQVEKFGW
ncbi:hypothetical protein B0J11DRAFT_516441 [Dendryphion nanum]|uniref:FAD-binding FR-type domain-containing protein n=1 Tax=Dendryphion nanum TaxID=256645 RepID=A0A9P9J2T3_9PLEO|nr:hypothetical protein B0J11DRAFT_516441 [Dendryphion nanum]